MVWRLRFIQVVLLKVQGTYFIQTLGCFMLYRFQLVDTCLTPRLGTSDLYQTWLLLNKVRYLYFIHMYVLKISYDIIPIQKHPYASIRNAYVWNRVDINNLAVFSADFVFTTNILNDCDLLYGDRFWCISICIFSTFFGNME